MQSRAASGRAKENATVASSARHRLSAADWRSLRLPRLCGRLDQGCGPLAVSFEERRVCVGCADRGFNRLAFEKGRELRLLEQLRQLRIEPGNDRLGRAGGR